MQFMKVKDHSIVQYVKQVSKEKHISHKKGSQVDIDTKFGADLEPDECKIVEGEDYIEIQYGAGFGEEVITSIAATVSLHYFGCPLSDKWFGQGNLAEMVLSAVTGRNDGEDDNFSKFIDGPDVDEDKLIKEKTLFEKTFIL